MIVTHMLHVLDVSEGTGMKKWWAKWIKNKDAG